MTIVVHQSSQNAAFNAFIVPFSRLWLEVRTSSLPQGPLSRCNSFIAFSLLDVPYIYILVYISIFSCQVLLSMTLTSS